MAELARERIRKTIDKREEDSPWIGVSAGRSSVPASARKQTSEVCRLTSALTRTRHFKLISVLLTAQSCSHNEQNAALELGQHPIGPLTVLVQMLHQASELRHRLFSGESVLPWRN
jgi:hypothetical protein